MHWPEELCTRFPSALSITCSRVLLTRVHPWPALAVSGSGTTSTALSFGPPSALPVSVALAPSHGSEISTRDATEHPSDKPVLRSHSTRRTRAGPLAAGHLSLAASKASAERAVVALCRRAGCCTP